MTTFDAGSSTALAGFIATVTSGDTINLTKVAPYASITTLAKRPSRSGVVSAFGYTITGNGKTINDTRIYQENVDGVVGAPKTLSNVTLNYTSTTGVAAAGGALLSVSNLNATQRVFDLQTVTFSGQHSGWNGNGNKYISFTAFESNTVDVKFDLTNSFVNITGQNNGFQTTFGVASGGSAFFHNWNNIGVITITDTQFDEKGFLSSFNLFNTSIVRGSASITGNTFKRTANANVRWEGNRLQNVNATLKGNTFKDGSYLDIYGSAGTVTIGGTVIGETNTFSTIAGGYGIRVNDPFTGTLTLSGTNVFSGGGLALKFVKATAGSYSITAGVTINGTSFDRMTAGGQSDDTITLASGNNWISGDLGNDTLTGGSGDDAFVFATTLNGTSNVDNITDFKASGAGTDKIWLANSVFSGLAEGGLSAGDFGTAAATGADVVFSGGSLYFLAGGSNDLNDYTKFANLTNTSTNTLINTDFVVF